MKKIIFKLVCLTIPYALLGACTSTVMTHHASSNTHSPAPSLIYTSKEQAVTLLGENGNYKISLYCNESPIPHTKIHTWTVHIETLDGKPLENAKVFVFGGMPMHRHDFPTVPKVKKYLGNGNYLVEGIKFNMIGHWEMRFNIEKDRIKDRVKFSIPM